MDQQQLDHILQLHREWWETMHEPEPRGQRADLSGLDLSGLNLYHACLTGANLRGTILRGCMLEGAIMFGCDLRGADLRGAEYRDIRVHGADLRGALVDDPRPDPSFDGEYWLSRLDFDTTCRPYLWSGAVDESLFLRLMMYEDLSDLSGLQILPDDAPRPACTCSFCV